MTAAADSDYCYLTTVGRVTGNPHTVELWFVLDGGCVYLIHERESAADWVRTIERNSDVTLRIGSREAAERSARGRVVADDAGQAVPVRAAMLEKYQPHSNSDLTHWATTGVIVAIDLAAS